MGQSPKACSWLLPLRSLNREPSVTPMQGSHLRRCFEHNAFIGRNARVRSCNSSIPGKFIEFHILQHNPHDLPKVQKLRLSLSYVSYHRCPALPDPDLDGCPSPAAWRL